MSEQLQKLSKRYVGNASNQLGVTPVVNLASQMASLVLPIDDAIDEVWIYVSSPNGRVIDGDTNCGLPYPYHFTADGDNDMSSWFSHLLTDNVVLETADTNGIPVIDVYVLARTTHSD